MFDVLVVGSGPAGSALAAACARTGLHTAILAPDPHAPWRPTYAAWAAELPADLPDSAVAAAVPEIRAVGTRAHRLDRRYVVLDNGGLRRHLHHPGVEHLAGLAATVDAGPHGRTVRLTDGTRLAARVVVDATGARRTLTGGPARPPVTEQTAAGFFLPADAARPLLDGAAAVFMDWRRPAADAVDVPSFLYAVPTGPDTVLVEETCLAHRPGLPTGLLRRRLRARLARHGLRPHDALGEEQVRFPVDPPRPRTRTVVPFGTAAGLQHPATGYSVATSLTLAPPLAAALADALPAGPDAAVAAARHTLWSRSAIGVHALRRRGLAVLLALPPDRVSEFFDAFFELPTPLQHGYQAERENMAVVTAAMTSLFLALPWTLRLRLATMGVGPRRSRYLP